jgi:hypothetical protein
MESLWVDHTPDEKNYESPSWHQDVLKHTESRVREGKTDFVDWEAAKKDMRRRHK